MDETRTLRDTPNPLICRPTGREVLINRTIKSWMFIGRGSGFPTQRTGVPSDKDKETHLRLGGCWRSRRIIGRLRPKLFVGTFLQSTQTGNEDSRTHIPVVPWGTVEVCSHPDRAHGDEGESQVQCQGPWCPRRPWTLNPSLHFLLPRSFVFVDGVTIKEKSYSYLHDFIGFVSKFS